MGANGGEKFLKSNGHDDEKEDQVLGGTKSGRDVPDPMETEVRIQNLRLRMFYSREKEQGVLKTKLI